VDNKPAGRFYIFGPSPLRGKAPATLWLISNGGISQANRKFLVDTINYRIKIAFAFLNISTLLIPLFLAFHFRQISYILIVTAC
jgi:hypothetical protein